MCARVFIRTMRLNVNSNVTHNVSKKSQRMMICSTIITYAKMWILHNEMRKKSSILIPGNSEKEKEKYGSFLNDGKLKVWCSQVELFQLQNALSRIWVCFWQGYNTFPSTLRLCDKVKHIWLRDTAFYILFVIPLSNLYALWRTHAVRIVCVECSYVQRYHWRNYADQCGRLYFVTNFFWPRAEKDEVEKKSRAIPFWNKYVKRFLEQQKRKRKNRTLCHIYFEFVQFDRHSFDTLTYTQQ